MKTILTHTSAAFLTFMALGMAITAAACGDETGTSSSGTSTSTSTSSGGTAGGGGTNNSGGSGGMGSGTGGTGGGMTGAPNLDPAFAWYGENIKTLDGFIDDVGVNSATYDDKNKPVAIFDWDNTVIKNDIGDLVTFWMLNNDKILQPPNKNWAVTSQFLTSNARNALNAACDSLADPGMPLPTSTNAACADAIVAIYYDGKTPMNQTAFTSWNYRRMEPAYAWTAQLQAGYTPAEVKEFGKQALEAALAANEGDTQSVGTRTMNAWARVYDQIKNLISVMQANGLDVWVVSASSQPIVEAFAEKVGIMADHVIGIRNVADANGKLDYNFQGCGDVPDGKNDGMGSVTGNSMITYIDGKRCWINKVIYGDTTANAVNQTANPKLRPAFGAGDSDTDITFLKDATGLRLVLNRNKNELMCNAYYNGDSKWIINPMFIQPKAKLATMYPCSTAACKDEAGMAGACLDENGNVIPDQEDLVFGP